MPQLWIVAGPNGAGKTTLVSRRLDLRIAVVNPDTIAQEIPRVDGRLDERRAGEIAIERRNNLLARGADFAIETTLAGNSALRFLKTAKKANYKVTLVYVGLASADLSVQRVLDRVRQGGHAVPVTALERRYPDTMSKLAQAILLADRSYIFDNSSRRRRLLVIRDQGRTRYVAPDLPEWADVSLAGMLE
ncbi:zeta toxin family protein [Sphingomonas oryzagri]